MKQRLVLPFAGWPQVCGGSLTHRSPRTLLAGHAGLKRHVSAIVAGEPLRVYGVKAGPERAELCRRPTRLYPHPPRLLLGQIFRRTEPSVVESICGTSTA
jgi:hypothetical protein